MLGYGIKETITGDGAATLNMALSAVSGFPRFSSKWSVGDLVQYSILDASVSPPVPVESGIGTVKASNTFDRTYPTDTWDGTTYTDISATKQTLVNGRTYLVINAPLAWGVKPPMHALSNANSATRRMNSPHNNGFASITLAVTALRLYVAPFLIAAGKPPVDLACRVSSAGAAGKLGRLVLYRIDETGALTDRLEESSSFAVDTTGIKSFSFGASKRYANGWYGVGFVSDGAPTINTIGTSGGAVGSTPFGVDANNQHIVCKSVDLGSLSCPNPWSGTVTNMLGNSNFPHITMGIAA